MEEEDRPTDVQLPRGSVENNRPSIEERRLQLDEKIEQEKLEIEKSRNSRESQFFRANLGIIITALVSFGAVIASAIQFYFTQGQEQRKESIEEHAKDAELQARIDDQRLKVLEYLTAHREDFFSEDEKVRKQLRTILLLGIPSNSLQDVLAQLPQSTPLGGQTAQVQGETIHFRWIPAGESDCPGRDVGSSKGEQPFGDFCNVGFLGRVAVCWDGARFVNTTGPSAQWCTYKSTAADQCTGGGARGRMYQCVAAAK